MRYFLFFILSSFTFIGSKLTNSNDQIIGNWISPDKDVIVNCYKVGDQYFGKVVWFKKYYDDKHGKNPTVPEDQWINSVVMKHFVFKDNEWKDGEIYDLNSGKSYSSFIEMDEVNSLKVTGYIWLSIFGETTVFNRYLEAKLPDFK